MNAKTCTTCGLRKPMSDYHLKSENPDGRRHTCKACAAEKGRRYRAENPGKVAETKRSWCRRNPDKVAELTQRFKERNPEYPTYIRPRDQDDFAQLSAKWAKRRADRVKATPLWFDAAKVQAIYRQAGRMRNAGFDVHVDHIYPLRGDLVCGLHVHGNLRIIPAKENLKKGKKVLDRPETAVLLSSASTEQ